MPLALGGLSQQPVGGLGAGSRWGAAGAGVGIHWHVGERGVGAGVKPVRAGGGPRPGWACLQPPSFLWLWSSCRLQQEPAPVVCNEKGLDNPTALLPGTPIAQGPPRTPESGDSCHPGTPWAPRPPSLPPPGTPCSPSRTSATQGPPGTSLQGLQILLPKRPWFLGSTDPATPGPLRDTRSALLWDPLHPDIPAHPSLAPTSLSPPSNCSCQADPRGWHSPGTGVIRCLLGGTSWWAGRRAGERTVSRERRWSPSPGCAHPAHCPISQPRSWRGGVLPERLFRASKASSSRGITILSNRPRSVGATTLLWGQRWDRLWPPLGWSRSGAEEQVGGSGSVSPHWMLLGYPWHHPPHIPQQEDLLRPVQDGQQWPHQILHTALMQVLRAQEGC